jgi:hypothetical protein
MKFKNYFWAIIYSLCGLSIIINFWYPLIVSDITKTIYAFLILTIFLRKIRDELIGGESAQILWLIPTKK